MTRPIRETGRGARMLTARRYLSLEPVEMAGALGVRPNTYQSWESGRDPIPVSVWADVDRLLEQFDAEVDKLIAAAAESHADRVRVRVWRSKSDRVPNPYRWMRVVGEAMRREPRIEPVFPEDDQDD